MKKPTMHCESCDEFVVDVVGEEIRCMAGFRPRFYRKQYKDNSTFPLVPSNDWGFKRRCNSHVLIPNEDQLDNIDSLIEIGYREYSIGETMNA